MQGTADPTSLFLSFCRGGNNHWCSCQAVGGMHVVSISEHLKLDFVFFPPARTWLSVSSINTSCGFFCYHFGKSFLRNTDKKEMLLHPLPVHTKYESNYKLGLWASTPDPALGC